MTSGLTAAPRTRPRGVLATAAATATVAVTVGVVLGATDLLCQVHLRYPWAELANSPAVWGLVACAVGAALAAGVVRAAAGAAGAMVVAVASYYLTATAVLGDAPGNAVSAAAVFWYAGGVGIGVTGGVAGAWARSSRTALFVLGRAFAPALALAEATVLWTADGHRLTWTASTATATMLAGVALVVVAVTVRAVCRRSPAALGAFVAAILALTAVGTLLYRLVGLHGFAT